MLALQVVPQLIPAGVEMSVPAPLTSTVNTCSGGPLLRDACEVFPPHPATNASRAPQKTP
jgi:hypothetical protein